MKKIIFAALILSSCSTSNNIGSSGLKVTTGATITPEKTAYVCLVADLDKMSKKGQTWLYTQFPQLKEKLNLPNQ